MDLLSLTNVFASLATLTLLEVVLGIDNLVFISILSQRLPQSKQKKSRQLGLSFAWITRLMLLASAVWITGLITPIVTLWNWSVSWRDILLLGGGLFLLYKATGEIHAEFELHDNDRAPQKTNNLLAVIIQIAILDIIFSLDSVITAIGLTQEFWIMTTAITIAIMAMIFASEPLSSVINKHPSIRMLALSFLLLIGIVLIADGLKFHIPRGYIYFTICFSLMVEILNLVRKHKKSRLSRH